MYNRYKDTLVMKELKRKLREIRHMTDNGVLKMDEVSKLCDQIIEHKSVLECIKSLPPTTAGYNPWHSAVKPGST